MKKKKGIPCGNMNEFDRVMNTRSGAEGSAFTPGPWHYSPEVSLHGTQLVYGPDGLLVADAGRISMRSDGEERANARLIAQAPAMLAALRKIQEFSWTLPHVFREADVWKDVDAVLNNVEGR